MYIRKNQKLRQIHTALIKPFQLMKKEQKIFKTQIALTFWKVYLLLTQPKYL